MKAAWISRAAAAPTTATRCSRHSVGVRKRTWLPGGSRSSLKPQRSSCRASNTGRVVRSSYRGSDEGGSPDSRRTASRAASRPDRSLSTMAPPTMP